MSWIEKLKTPKIRAEQKTGFPEGLWKKCDKCSEIIFHEDLTKNLMVCPKCRYHMEIGSRERLEIILDHESFEELDANMSPNDPLDFKDLKKYKDRIKNMEKIGIDKEAYIYGRGTCNKLPLIIGTFVFDYMGGSMGSVVGEKITRTFELAEKENKPCLIVTSSGGARMQEGILSLMQMAKSTAALARLRQKGLPYIVLLAHPTTGGVAASIAMLGDIQLAEPNALIGFAGPRVIEQTIKEKLPPGFQHSEFLLEHGMVDRIVHRQELKSEIHYILSVLTTNRTL
jgi:acetyl-CoA carboxylase carboxyl transferase subunit beta